MSCWKCVREPLSAEANTSLCLPPVSFFLYHHHPAGWNSCRRKTTPQFFSHELFLTWTFSQFSQTHCQEAFGHSCCCLEIQHHMCLWNRQKYNCSNLYLTSVTWSLMDSPDVSAALSLSGRHNRGISGCLENTDQINKTSWQLSI